MALEKEEISRKFLVQSENKSRVNTSSAQDRISKLKKIRGWIYANRQTLRDALYADLGKPALESDLWEVRSHLTGSRIARVLFTVHGHQMALLHGFIKKSQKTAANDLKVARNRRDLWQNGW